MCSYVPGLQSLVNAFSQCWDRLLLVFIPLFGLMYWFSTVGFLLFGKSCQDSAGNLDPLKCGGWDYFGTLGEAMWTLLQIATMDSWSSDIARTLYDVCGGLACVALQLTGGVPRTQHGVAWRLDVHLLRVVHRAVRVLLVVRVWASAVGTGVGACLTAVCVVRPAATSSQASVRTQHCSVLPSDISPSLLRSRRCVCVWVAVVDAISQESPIDGEEAAQPGPRSANKAPSPAAASGVELTSMRPGTPQVRGIGVGALLTGWGVRACAGGSEVLNPIVAHEAAVARHGSGASHTAASIAALAAQMTSMTDLLTQRLDTIDRRLQRLEQQAKRT